MPCYRPLTAYRGPGGAITFNEGGDSGAALELPCGRCIGCRIKRVQDWQMRIMNEAQLHLVNSFITLTYREEDLEERSLNYKHFQRFMRDLRRAKGPVRFFAAGEYGEQTFRPHWHAILFGVTFNNQYPIGKDLNTSKELESLWGRGNTSIGEVNNTTAAYVASYCIKKATGPQAEERYQRYDTSTGEIFYVTPEMARMSLKPGIGARWYTKYQQEIHYARDGIVRPGGFTGKPPRYYDKLLQQNNIQQYTQLETERQIEAITREKDNTTQRLQAKEIVAIAKQSQKRKRL
jgi:hypothetical protein